MDPTDSADERHTADVDTAAGPPPDDAELAANDWLADISSDGSGGADPTPPQAPTPPVPRPPTPPWEPVPAEATSDAVPGETPMPTTPPTEATTVVVRPPGPPAITPIVVDEDGAPSAEGAIEADAPPADPGSEPTAELPATAADDAATGDDETSTDDPPASDADTPTADDAPASDTDTPTTDDPPASDADTANDAPASDADTPTADDDSSTDDGAPTGPVTGSDADAEDASATDPATDGEPTAAIAATPSPTGVDEPTAVLPATSGPGASTAPTRVTGPRPGRVALLIAGATVGLYLLLAAAWAIDTAAHDGQAMRGVQLGDIDVGGQDRDELSATVSTLAERLADEDLTVTIGSTTVDTDPVSLGAVPDGEALIEEALAARRGGFLPLRPISWLAGLFSGHVVEPRYTIDPAATRQGVAAILLPELAAPVEPEVEFDGDELAVVAGTDGVTVDAEQVIDELAATIDAGQPYRLTIPELVAEPQLDQDELEGLVDELNTATSQPIAVQVLDKRAEVSPNTQRSWIRLDTEGERLGWTVDEEAALAALQPLFPVLGSEDQQARFEIVDGEPIIIPADETVVCCAQGSAAVLAEAIGEPPAAPSGDGEGDADDEEPELRTASLDPIVTGRDEGVAELESLGIVELVSTFTTNHACCENRVRNIQRFADLTQGAIIRPGENFSLNGFVGRRTSENGFFPAGAIAQGNFEDQVGGGISQYATTFFNAAFFAGLEFIEYQSHSIYISRYPRGREATISWPRPDLNVLNNTPYGILVWNEYTPTSITVSFYSTKHLEVEALDLLRSSDRQCRIDITPRRITYEDGTIAEDRVRAIYRPGEGLDCNGQSTRPEEDEPAPASPPPSPPPDPDPDPEPEPDPPEPEPDPRPDSEGDAGGRGDNGGEVLPTD